MPMAAPWHGIVVARPRAEAEASTDRAAVERTFYRIVRGPDVVEDDFTSARDLGKPLRDPSLERQCGPRGCRSTTRSSATAQARLYRYRLGRFVVAVTLTADAGVEVDQSGNHRLHYTLHGMPSQLMGLVIDRPRRADEE